MFLKDLNIVSLFSDYALFSKIKLKRRKRDTFVLKIKYKIYS